MFTQKFTFDGIGINDSTNEYRPRVATLEVAYRGRKDIGRLLESAPELLEVLQGMVDNHVRGINPLSDIEAMKAQEILNKVRRA